MGLLDRLKRGISKTRDLLAGGLRRALFLGRALDESLLSDLEDALLRADLGPKTTSALLDEVRAAWKEKTVRTSEEVLPFLRDRIADRLRMGGNEVRKAAEGPTVILVCGVNGSGKPTSIGKLTSWLKERGGRVVLGAADTFRAAAVEQL